MKQFSLDEYHKNPSRGLVTRSGLNVRIVCDDAPGDFPVIAIIDKMSKVDNCVTHVAYRKEGWINPDGTPFPYDLFLPLKSMKDGSISSKMMMVRIMQLTLFINQKKRPKKMESNTVVI